MQPEGVPLDATGDGEIDALGYDATGDGAVDTTAPLPPHWSRGHSDDGALVFVHGPSGTTHRAPPRADLPPHVEARVCHDTRKCIRRSRSANDVVGRTRR